MSTLTSNASKRAVVILKPQPILRELIKAYPLAKDAPVGTALKETVLIIPDGSSSDTYTDFFMQHTESILTREFQRRVPYPEVWPMCFDYETLDQYFLVELHTILIAVDAADGKSVPSDTTASAADHAEPRFAVLVQPKKLAQLWFNQISTQFFKQPLSTFDTAMFAADATVYLFQQTQPPKEQWRSYLQQHYRQIFEFELAQFIEDVSTWTNPRTLDIFMQWYRFEINTQVFVY